MPPVPSASLASDMAGPSHQPFQCVVCLKRFTRHENLKRHTVLHSQSHADTSFPCDFCSTTFARQDLRWRHIKYKHPEVAAESVGPTSTRSRRTRPTRPARSSSTSTSPLTPTGQQSDPQAEFSSAYQLDSQAESSSTTGDFDMGIDGWDFALLGHTAGTDSAGPANQLFRNDTVDGCDTGSHLTTRAQDTHTEPQVTVQNSRIVSPLVPDNNLAGASATSSVAAIPSRSAQCIKFTPPEYANYIPDDWFPTVTQINRGIDLFFYHVAHFFPFIHEPTFDPSVAGDYLVLSMCCLGYQYGNDADSATLSLRCFQTARQLVTLNEDNASDLTHKLDIVKAYLLLQVYSMMYLEGEGGSDGMRMHSRIIGLSRSSGLMQPLPTNPTATSDLESLWREFIKAESHKRTMLALHHMDALWYQILSVPRSISHLEIKHDMPCHDSLWTTSSASDWAHRTLTASQKCPPIRYSEAIRRFLSPLPEPGDTLQLELLGALNVIHFLQSSLREVSGWSAMTGRVTSDRFEALTASLAATEPFIRSRASDSQWIFVEATWEMAMLETLSWSPSHMGGIVEVSLDAALATSACLATSPGFIVDPAIARSLSTHVNWFLLYLEETMTPDREPPFVTVYAFKAFLIAWQLLRGVAPSAMAVVGIADGDSDAALAWAARVFARRRRWKVGKLVLQNLASLAESTGEL